MTAFEPAVRLCRGFYFEVLAGVIGVPHAAGLLGPGSDVLGYDTERSTDHDWGPRALIFVDPAHVGAVRERVTAALPTSYRDWPVNIGRDGLPLRPQVEVTTVSDWASRQLGENLAGRQPSTTDWLLIPQQRLLEVVKGAVFFDSIGELTRLQTTLAWYPDHVWWWMLACQWHRLAQEEPIVQRTFELGDRLGTAIVTARLSRDVMRLALLSGRAYSPYIKWLGTAFGRLPDRDGLGEHLERALNTPDFSDRETALGLAFQTLARRFNALSPELSVDTSLRSFHDRPATVLGADRFVRAALDKVTDAHLLRLPLIGSIDQFSDSTDLLVDPRRCHQLRILYAANNL